MFVVALSWSLTLAAGYDVIYFVTRIISLLNQLQNPRVDPFSGDQLFLGYIFSTLDPSKACYSATLAIKWLVHVPFCARVEVGDRAACFDVGQGSDMPL